MTREDLAPIGHEDPGFPCPKCSGSGVQRDGVEMYGATINVILNCQECGGSGFGPPPPALDRLRAHCLERLSRWAQRNLPPPEEMED